MKSFPGLAGFVEPTRLHFRMSLAQKLKPTPLRRVGPENFRLPTRRRAETTTIALRWAGSHADRIRSQQNGVKPGAMRFAKALDCVTIFGLPRAAATGSRQEPARIGDSR